MRTAVLLLAALGFAAAALRMVRSLFFTLHGGVDAFLARDLADTRAQRGDLTGVADARDAHATARRRRMLALGAASFWAGLLLVPPLTPWPELLYASYSLLWLLPRRRIEHRHS
jgi:hypothetical protein